MWTAPPGMSSNSQMSPQLAKRRAFFREVCRPDFTEGKSCNYSGDKPPGALVVEPHMIAYNAEKTLTSRLEGPPLCFNKTGSPDAVPVDLLPSRP